MIINNVQIATDLLQKGKVLAYPTESVWGLGCDPYQKVAFKALLNLKKRASEKGVILVCANESQLERLLKPLPTHVREKMRLSWQECTTSQQATTWLVPVHAQANIPAWITGNHATVAVRITPHPQVKALCEAFGGMLVSTSCNTAGKAPAKSLQEAKSYFASEVCYLDGETLGYKKPSKIINALTGQVLR